MVARHMTRAITALWRCQKEFRTRNSSGDEIANVNFLYDDIVHVLQNTIRLVHSATDRRGGYVWNACLPNSVK